MQALLNLHKADKTVPCPFTQKQLDAMQVCLHCVRGDLHVSPFSTSTDMASSLSETPRGAVWHSDIFGPVRVAGPHGERYMILFVEATCNFCKVYLVEKRSEFSRVIKQWHTDVTAGIVDVNLQTRAELLVSDKCMGGNEFLIKGECRPCPPGAE